MRSVTEVREPSVDLSRTPGRTPWGSTYPREGSPTDFLPMLLFTDLNEVNFSHKTTNGVRDVTPRDYFFCARCQPFPDPEGRRSKSTGPTKHRVSPSVYSGLGPYTQDGPGAQVGEGIALETETLSVVLSLRKSQHYKFPPLHTKTETDPVGEVDSP